MYNAQQVKDLIAELKEKGCVMSDVAWQTALACVGWAYVFGARGQYCDPVNRRNYYFSHGSDHPTIKSACKNFDGSDQVIGACSTCKFYAKGRTRFFDCRGFTYWIIKQVYGFEIQGAGATSQWNTASNWKAKGEIANMPKDTLCCLFVKKNNTMEHTGFGYNDQTIECSSGVQYFAKRKAKWTHWAVPACVDQEIIPAPSEPEKDDKLPTLRKGNKGQYVTLLQTKLANLGYDLGKCGVDGDFGSATLAAVKQFQKDRGLTVDGVVGAKTWSALEQNEPAKLYTVTIKGLVKAKADEIVKVYGGIVTAE